MSPELDAALVRDFPKVYQDRGASMQNTGMCWGFMCSDAWEPLIRRLSEKLEDMDVIATQVKEKYGTLRFYTLDGSPDVSRWQQTKLFIQKLLGIAAWIPCCPRYHLWCYWKAAQDTQGEYWINQACAESARTCEECGSRGRLRDHGGWLTTLCDACEERR